MKGEKEPRGHALDAEIGQAHENRVDTDYLFDDFGSFHEPDTDSRVCATLNWGIVFVFAVYDLMDLQSERECERMSRLAHHQTRQTLEGYVCR